MTKHTQRIGIVKLTLSQWNTLFCAMSDARQFNVEHGYKATADEVAELKNVIREQIGAKVHEAFAHDYPDYQKAS